MCYEYSQEKNHDSLHSSTACLLLQASWPVFHDCVRRQKWDHTNPRISTQSLKQKQIIRHNRQVICA